jgi:hypothetical protein
MKKTEKAVAPAPFVGQAGADAAHGRDERFKQFHAMVESVFSFPRQPPTQSIRRTQNHPDAKMRTAGQDLDAYR